MVSDPAEARDYLLGELPDERSGLLEQAILADRDLLELVEQVECDLVDDYVDDQLSPADRARFEGHYLASAAHRDRVAVARALLGHGRNVGIEAEPERTTVASGEDRWFPRLARALGVGTHTLGWAAALVLLAIVGALALEQWRSGVSDVRVPAVAETPPADRPPAPERRAAPMRVALLLPAISTRSGTETTPGVAVASDVTFVDLLLEGTQSRLAAASAEIRTVDDRVVWTGTSAPPSTAHLATPHVAIVSVPAERLPPDDYILTMRRDDEEVIGRYFFRIAAER